MDQKNLRTLFQKTKEGSFSECLPMLQKTQLNNDSAVKMVIFVSHACCACLKQGRKLDEETLYRILSSIVNYIKTPNDVQVLQYMQALYHILRYYNEQENFKFLSKMDFAIIPEFFNNSALTFNEQVSFTYQQIINILLKCVIRMSKKENTTHTDELVTLSKIIVKGCFKRVDLTQTLNYAQRCCKILILLNIESDLLFRFYVSLLELIQSAQLEVLLHNIEELANILEHILEYLISGHYFHEVNLLLNKTSKWFHAKGEMTDVCGIFEILTIMCPGSSKSPKIIDKWKSSMEIVKIQNMNLFCKILSKVNLPLQSLMIFYNSEGVKKFTALPLDFVTKLIFCFKWICNSFFELETECSCRCGLQLDYFRGMKLGCLLSSLIKKYIDENKNLRPDFYQHTKNWLCYFIGHLNIFIKHNCEKFSLLWKELGIYIYNIGTSLYMQKNDGFEAFFMCFLKYSFKYEGNSPTILKSNMSESAFNSICEKKFSDGSYEVAMAFAALYSLMYPKQRILCFQKWWAKSKLKLKLLSHVQQFTLVSILEKYHTTLECITDPGSILSHDVKVDLLSFELQHYKMMWKSKESMMASFKQLMHMVDLSVLSKIIVEIYGDIDMQIHDDMYELFDKLIKKLETQIKKSEDPYLKLSLSILYYYHYKNSSKEVVNKHVHEMEQTIANEEHYKQTMEPIPKDPNDECDIVSAYESLKLECLNKMLDFLNKGLDLMALLSKHNLADLLIANTCYSLLLIYALEYRLHCFGLRKLQAYELSLGFAEFIGDPTKLLYSISYIIETSDIKKNLIQNLVLKGDDLVINLTQDNEKKQHNKVVITYYICKAKAYLYVDSSVSYNAYKNAEELYNSVDDHENMDFLKVELLILDYKLSKSCDLGNHQEDPMTTKLHKAMDITVTWVYGKPMSPQEICILFDTIFELSKLYYLMKLPRDLRCYTKNSVLLAQKLLLPLRCVSFLILLAYSDLFTANFDHCNVKLNGISDIFNLENSKFNYIANSCDEQYLENKESDIDIVTGQIQELALDLPQHSRQYAPSSPILRVEGFSFPAFVAHDDHCCCFSCMCLEYHKLLLEKNHLDALLNLSQKQITLGEEFLNGGQKMYKKLRNNYVTYKLKAKTFISEDLIIDFDDYFMECYSNTLFAISSQAIRKEQKKKALDVNGQLLELLKPKKVQFVYLYTDAIIQRLSYLMPTISHPSDYTKETIEFINERTAVTPESKQTQVTFSASECPTFSPPKQKVRPVILFESPSPNKDNEAPGGKSTKKYDKLNVVSKAKDNKLVLSTPAQTPKLQIYRDIKTYSTRSKKMAAPKQVESLSSQNSNNDGGVENCRPKGILAGACASTSKKCSQRLKVKVREDVVIPGPKSTETVRKNLMKEWTGSKQDVKVMTSDQENGSSKSDTDSVSIIDSSQENNPYEGTSALNMKYKDLAEKLKKSIKKKNSEFKHEVPQEVTKNLFTNTLDDRPSSTKTSMAVRKSTRKRIL